MKVSSFHHKKNYEELLKGGDLRSLGQVDQLISEITQRRDFEKLFSLMWHPDKIVATRATDAIEKISRNYPEWLDPHRKVLLDRCLKVPDKMIRWHLALLLPRLRLHEEEVGMAWDCLRNRVQSTAESKIVRVNSLQALFELTKNHPPLRTDLLLLFEQVEREHIPSLNARIRKLRKVLTAAPDRSREAD